MKKIFFLMLGTMFVIGMATIVWSSVLDTPHDIVPGNEPCAYCHTPHNAASYPLWNRIQDSDPGSYQMYASNSFDMGLNAPLDQPLFPSNLCLICHNGVASSLVNYPGPCGSYNESYDVILEGCGNLTTDLRDDHPISFDYVFTEDFDKNGFIAPVFMPGLGSTRQRMAIQGQIHTNVYYPLFGDDRISIATRFECATCHAVHHTADPMYDGAGDTQVYFLRSDNTRSELCRDCHINR